jgi:hypothetical protein
MAILAIEDPPLFTVLSNDRGGVCGQNQRGVGVENAVSSLDEVLTDIENVVVDDA